MPACALVMALFLSAAHVLGRWDNTRWLQCNAVNGHLQCQWSEWNLQLCSFKCFKTLYSTIVTLWRSAILINVMGSCRKLYQKPFWS